MGVDEVPFRFRFQSHEESLFNILIATTRSKDFSYIDLLIGKETGSDLAIRSQSKSIAIAAEVATHCSNQSNLTGGPFDSKSFGRSIPLI